MTQNQSPLSTQRILFSASCAHPRLETEAFHRSRSERQVHRKGAFNDRKTVFCQRNSLSLSHIYIYSRHPVSNEEIWTFGTPDPFFAPAPQPSEPPGAAAQPSGLKKLFTSKTQVITVPSVVKVSLPWWENAENKTNVKHQHARQKRTTQKGQMKMKRPKQTKVCVVADEEEPSEEGQPMNQTSL